MTDDEIAAIREALDQPSVSFDDAMLMLNRLVPELLAENAALREIAQAVANRGALVQDCKYACWTCGLCDATSSDFINNPVTAEGDIEHTADCVVTKARALLAKEAE